MVLSHEDGLKWFKYSNSQGLLSQDPYSNIKFGETIMIKTKSGVEAITVFCQRIIFRNGMYAQVFYITKN